MSRPLPDCALCGESLTKRPRVIHQWGKRGFGSPSVGWHEGCDDKDPAYKGYCAFNDPKKLMAIIADRGPFRIVKLCAYPEKGGQTWRYAKLGWREK